MTENESKPTVLIVEDERGLADLYSVWLQDCANVKTAYDGATALEQLDDGTDLVFLDRRMPGVSGDDVLETIRERGIDARVAIVSGVDPGIDIIEMGFDDYLTKPVSRADLREALDRMLTRAEYDNHIQELLALISKRNALEAQSETAALADMPEYQEMTDEIEALRDAADDLVEKFDDRDFRVVFRDTQPDPPSDDSTQVRHRDEVTNAQTPAEDP